MTAVAAATATRASSVAAKPVGSAFPRLAKRFSHSSAAPANGRCVMSRRDRVVREVYRKQIWKLNPETVRLGLASIAEIRRLQQEKEASNG